MCRSSTLSCPIPPFEISLPGCGENVPFCSGEDLMRRHSVCGEIGLKLFQLNSVELAARLTDIAILPEYSSKAAALPSD